MTENEQTTTQRSRNANFDMLKCLCMLMIVGIHFFTHGLFKDIEVWQDSDFNYFASSERILRFVNRIFSEYIFIIFCIAVNCFVLITGYFMVNSKLRINRIIIIWLQTIFYSLVIPLLLIPIAGKDALLSIVHGLTPICSNVYWFVTMYLGLMALSPFLIISMNRMDKRHYKLLLVLLTIINIAVIWNIPLGKLYSKGTGLLFFIYIFLVGGYIKLYDLKFGKCKYGVTFFVLSALVLIWTLLQETVIGLKHQMGLYHLLNSYNSLLFFMSVLAFLWFKNLRLNNNLLKKWAIAFSPYVFGVYLISDHPLLRLYLWGLFDWKSLMNSPFLLLIMFISICFIFLVCIIIDYFRSLLFKFLKVHVLSEYMSCKMECLLAKIE